MSVRSLAAIYPQAERFHRTFLTDPSLATSELRMVRGELCSWYREWSKHEFRVSRRPARALALLSKAFPLNPLAQPTWRLAARFGWAALRGGMCRSAEWGSA